jgi:hypothetical protein
LFGAVAGALYRTGHIVAMIGSAGWGLDQRASSARLGTSSAEGSVPSRPPAAIRLGFAFKSPPIWRYSEILRIFPAIPSQPRVLTQPVVATATTTRLSLGNDAYSKGQPMFHAISTDRFDKPESGFNPGPAPQLRWLEIKDLVVDLTYQREIGKRGSANIRQIAENFDWSKFAPVIVAPLEGGQWAVVDGQHRTTAAMLRSIEKVPCQVVQADRAQQAAAYAAVNGSVTKTTAQQLYYAKLTAGHPECAALQEVLAASGVEVARRNLVVAKMKVGQTQAVGALSRCLREYGSATLITALQCITQTADGNAGFVRATIIEGICEVLHKNRRWCEAGDGLLRAMDNLSFLDMWEEVSGGRDQIFPATVRRLVAEKITAHLTKFLGPTSRAAVRPDCAAAGMRFSI